MNTGVGYHAEPCMAVFAPQSISGYTATPFPPNPQLVSSSITLQADQPMMLIAQGPIPFLPGLANPGIMPGTIPNLCRTRSFSSTLSDPFSRQKKTGHPSFTAFFRPSITRQRQTWRRPRLQAMLQR